LIHLRPCSILLHLVTFKVKTLAISQKQTLWNFSVSLSWW
jgi:hypothetical protein